MDTPERSNVSHSSFPRGIPAEIHPLQDISLNLVRLLLAITGVGVALVSILARATLLDIVFRTAGAMILVGILGWALNFFLGKFLVDATVREMCEKFVQDENKNRELNITGGLPGPKEKQVN